jgi:hypothetical protein
MFLALLETSANQQFIFSTNKLRENIGASELTYMAGTQWVVKAVCEVNGQNCDSEIFDRSDGLRKWLLNSEKNLSIDNDDDSKKIEILIATSGKALFLAKKKEDAQKVIEKVTLRALKEAPGLDICGIISNPFDLTDKKLNDVNAAIHKNFDTVHGRKSGPVNRFLRLPVVDQCASSGLPANKSIQDADGKSITSLVSEAKRNHRDRGFKRIQTLLTEENERWKLIEKDSDFEEESSWKAIVHADGNGLGQIFLDFGKSIQTNPESKDEKEYNRLYIQKYRQFSLAIDICTEKAFLEAIRTVFADRLGVAQK